MAKKTKGGGTTKVCLPASKVRSMSAAEKKKVVNAKKSAAASGKYKRSSKSNVKGARKKVLHLEIGLKKKTGLMQKLELRVAHQAELVERKSNGYV